MDLSQNWLLMAVLTPILWAIACLLDSCLIGNRIYRSALDGTVFTCLFSVLPVIWILGQGIGEPIAGTHDYDALSAGVIAGLCFVVHLVFYFRTLHRINDVSGAETFVTLSVLIVPLFAWMILGENLPPRYYFAILLAGVGVLLYCLPLLKQLGTGVLADMCICLLTISLAMVLQARTLDQIGFASATLIFNLTCLIAALILLIVLRPLRIRVFSIARRVPLILVVGECLGLLALVCSHRATQVGPSVSLVALIECLLPLIIILISALTIAAHRLVPILSSANYRMLVQQITSLPSKILALTLLLASVSSLSL
ncbi:MAG: EamA family transporter [Gammaproteobacteria bacterium]|nr:EamA family transporter [Gammaproteobacteria bacterium]